MPNLKRVEVRILELEGKGIEPEIVPPDMNEWDIFPGRDYSFTFFFEKPDFISGYTIYSHASESRKVTWSFYERGEFRVTLELSPDFKEIRK